MATLLENLHSDPSPIFADVLSLQNHEVDMSQGNTELKSKKDKGCE